MRRAETSGRWQHSRVLATLRRRGHLMRPRVVDQNVRLATADGENYAVSRGRHSRIGGFSFHVNPRPFPAGPQWSEFKSLRSVSDGIYLPHTPLLSGEYDTHREAPENSFFFPQTMVQFPEARLLYCPTLMLLTSWEFSQGTTAECRRSHGEQGVSTISISRLRMNEGGSNLRALRVPKARIPRHVSWSSWTALGKAHVGLWASLRAAALKLARALAAWRAA